jgi:hypothetical protein
MITPSPLFGSLDSDWLPVVWSCVWKITALLAVTACVAIAARRCSAARRYEMWTSSLVATLLLPILILALPAWHVLPRSLVVTHPIHLPPG